MTSKALQLIKAFLLRCEALGWVSRDGWIKSPQLVRLAREWWTGAQVAALLSEKSGEDWFPHDLARQIMIADPFAVAKAAHEEACAALHARRVTA